MNPVEQIRKRRPFRGRRTPVATHQSYATETSTAQVTTALVNSQSDPSADIARTSIEGSSSVTNVKDKHSRKRRRKKGPCTALDPDLVPSSAPMLASPTYCQKCGAKKFEYEPPLFCCRDGAVKLATNDYPDELVRLFDSQDEDALHFRTYARLYNNLFAFSSLGGAIECHKKKGIFVFSLHGQLYHFIPPLTPQDDTPRYLQLYFYDAVHERENRASFFDVLRPDVISIIMNVMERNPYASFFSSLREKAIDETTTILINKNVSLDQRVYNAPTSDEVAAIWCESSSDIESSGPYIVVTGKGNETHRIMHYYGCYDPLQYPLLFPFGDSGWHQGIKKATSNGSTLAGTRAPVLAATDTENLLLNEHLITEQRGGKSEKYVSCREYYAYVFQIRPGNHLLKAGRLLLQFLVDMYVKLENSRLDFLRNNQATIRADLYQGILDTLDAGEVEGSNVGRRVILPPSFIGGPRDMRKRYLNAMRLVQKYGKPDLFITMTCNPNWPEIKQELKPGEQPQDRPDLISRIFRAKLTKAKKMFMKEHIMGEVEALVYVVEFQKRGLPHAHFLIILKPQYKIKCVDDFDKFVSAELPSPNQPHLRKMVIQHMMHGPCGINHQDCPCMRQKEGRKICRFSYPKEFVPCTTTNDDGYPLYRRRPTGETVRVRGHSLDNRWVIPYNPYLLAYFDCHINVEVCSTIQAVKYLYKYVYKGHDKISFNVVQSTENQVFNEIDHYQSGRWLSPPEAAWRIFGFELYEMFPSVFPLQIHLPNMQSIQFHPHEQLPKIAADARRSRTPLTEFFSVNASCPNGHSYVYADFPEYFTWDFKKRQWKARKQRNTIGRLTFVNPAEGERFYLRVLLAHVSSPKSFDDLLTVDDYVCSSFQEAAIRRGLIERGNALEQSLDEAVQIHMPQALRRLFVTALIFAQPPDPVQMWNKYYTALSEDYRHEFPDVEAKVLNLTVTQIERLLEGMGKTLADFNLEYLQAHQANEVRLTKDIQDAIDAPIPEQYIAARKLLNDEQKKAYKAILEYVKLSKPGVFFIDGPGGTGKTFLYCALYAKVRQMNKIVLPTATSGIAAANLPTGRTAHSRFKLPIDLSVSLTCDVPKQGSLAALLKQTHLIIWDEASMANKGSVHSLDLLLRDLCIPNVPFGGKIVVFGGDFRQVLPVLPKKSQNEAVLASLVYSSLWPEFIRYRLSQNMRAKQDSHYASFLLALGDGKLQNKEFECIQIPHQIVLPVEEKQDSVSKLADFIFPAFTSTAFPHTDFTDKAILTPKNEDVDLLNKFFIDKFIGESVTYNSFDSILDEHCNIYPTEFLHTLCPGGMSPHELTLKLNCPVILLRNIDPSSGLCNGTRLTCKQFFKNLILCEIATGFHKGEQVLLPRIRLRPSTSSNFPFKFERKQFPIKLCFAMTINKSQGQTLNEVGVYLHQPCFSHGQLYVALSRARMASKIKVLLKSNTDTAADAYVQNVISFDILERAGII